jgi:hypothetical protein
MMAVLVPAAHGEWSHQDLVLQPGWNAVYLTVDPEPSEPAAVFANAPVKSVWTWNKRFKSSQFLRDPNTLLPEEEEWLTWFPTGSFNEFLSTLFAVQGGKAYLIEIDGSTPVSLRIKGKVRTDQMEWLSDSFNLVGFNVDPQQPPTFESFFSPAKELRGEKMYRLNAEGNWEEIADKANTRVDAGKAYLIHCRGTSSYSGPLFVKTEIPGGLKYDLDIRDQRLILKNETDLPKTVTISLLPTERVAEAGSVPLAGEVSLYYKRLLAWHKIDEPLSVTVKPNSEGSLDLAVKRGEMATPANEKALFENTLVVKDGEGSLLRLPVTARKTLDDAGLYVGLVKLDAVSEVIASTSTPTETPSEFRFRIIVHKDDAGTPKVSLLQHVTVMQVQESEAPDPSNPGGTITVPSRYVLLTDDALIPQYEGVSLRDGEIVGRRITAPVFGFDAPVTLTPNLNDGNIFEAQITMPYDDPLNPFLHRYHPDHNNLNENYEPFRDSGGVDVSEGVESFTFTRTIRLTFTPEDPENLGEIAWGYDLVGGTYEETISGVHKRDIKVKGTFRLNRVSTIAKLNDQI